MFEDDQVTSLSVIVYQYTYWDAARGVMVKSNLWATAETIRNGLGVPILETGRKVPRRSIDAAGRLKAGFDDDPTITQTR